MSELQHFLAARDGLLSRRTDLDAASAHFSWPALSHFNWAIDYFDAIAHDNDKPALHIVEESGIEAKLTYAQLSQRSSQVANFLVSLGARAGDRMLLMLGNEVPLWETMLAAIKLGVVVIPATTLLSGADLTDRIARGRVRWILTNATGQCRVAELSHDAIRGVGRNSQKTISQDKTTGSSNGAQFVDLEVDVETFDQSVDLAGCPLGVATWGLHTTTRQGAGQLTQGAGA
jgi:acetyl-CoA synthetase